MNILSNLIREQVVARFAMRRSASYVSSLASSVIHPNATVTWCPSASAAKADSVIPIDKLEITYSRSTGPGGQNVNKVNTKVDLRFHVDTATWINADIKSKLSAQNKRKITKDGFIVFRSDLTRSQQLNLADCLHKLRTCIASASSKDNLSSSDDAETIETRRKRADRAIRHRLEWKRARSELKESRRDVHIV